MIKYLERKGIIYYKRNRYSGKQEMYIHKLVAYPTIALAAGFAAWVIFNSHF